MLDACLDMLQCNDLCCCIAHNLNSIDAATSSYLVLLGQGAVIRPILLSQCDNAGATAQCGCSQHLPPPQQ